MMAAAAVIAVRIGNTRETAPLVPVNTEVAPEPAELMRLPIGWMEAQFRSLGRPDAPGLALQLRAA
jgi:hypothetical protein